MSDQLPRSSSAAASSKEANKQKKKSNTATNDSSTKHRRQQHRTLCSLLHYFEGMELSVELKTGRIYRGTLSSADEYMNLVLDDAQQIEPKQITPLVLLSCHIRGPNIRYIHFDTSPSHQQYDLKAVIRQGQDRERAARQKYQKGTRNTRSVTTGGKAQIDMEQTK